MSRKIERLQREGVRHCGVVGDPIAHSLSPLIHEKAYEVLGIPWEYQAYHARSIATAQKLFSQVKDGVLIGLNVTMPYKVPACEFADTYTKEALAAASANTLFLQENMLCGANTDGEGLVASLRNDLDLTIEHARVVLLGTGATAAAVAYALKTAKAKEVWVVSREQAKAEACIERLAGIDTPKRDLVGDTEYRATTYDLLASVIGACDAIINTTPLGMRKGDPSPLPQEYICAHHAVLDVVYGTPHKTMLLHDAQKQGARAIDGRGMLVEQAARSISLWTQIPVTELPLIAMRATLDEALAQRTDR